MLLTMKLFLTGKCIYECSLSLRQRAKKLIESTKCSSVLHFVQIERTWQFKYLIVNLQA